MKTRMMNLMLVVTTLCFLEFLVTSKGFAQIYTTLPPPWNWTVTNAYYPQPNPAQMDNCDYICAEGFTIGSSGAYVSRLDMALVGTNFTENNADLGTASVPITCTFTWSIVTAPYPTGAVGFTILSDTKTVTVQPNSGETNVTPAVIPFTDTFGAQWLPPGNYYLMMRNGQPSMNGNPSTGCNADLNGGGQANPPANLDWDLDYLVSVPNVGPGFSAMFKPDPTTWTTAHGTFAFDLIGPAFFLPPVGGGPLQIARLVVAGPVTPLPGGPVQAQVGFVNAMTGTLLSPLTPITINSGSQLQSVDLNLTPFAGLFGQRIEVQPVIVQSPNAAGDVQPGPVQISATVQMLDALTGFETVLAPLAATGGPVGMNPGPTNVSSLSPQVLAGGQTMRFDVVAAGPDACVAQVSFNDANGNPLAPSTSVNLPSGTGTTVDLNANTLGFPSGTRIEVQPVITATAPAAAAAQNSVCSVSLEVFDHLTGRTASHQSATVGLPAVQSPAGTPGLSLSAAAQ